MDAVNVLLVKTRRIIHRALAALEENPSQKCKQPSP